MTPLAILSARFEFTDRNGNPLRIARINNTGKELSDADVTQSARSFVVDIFHRLRAIAILSEGDWIPCDCYGKPNGGTGNVRSDNPQGERFQLVRSTR